MFDHGERREDPFEVSAGDLMLFHYNLGHTGVVNNVNKIQIRGRCEQNTVTVL